MKESEIVKGVIELLYNPGSWIKGCSSKDINNRHVSANESEAVKFCLGGAVTRVLANNGIKIGGWSEDPIAYLFRELAMARGYYKVNSYGDSLTFVAFNDDPDTTHEDLMLFLKEALYEAEEREIDARF